ncbi:1-acyl-sn-glycerol-3-phosphate acyltransferase [bacterium]|nr:1-acyl-sn-glycerol-3-phosphate acyltransferase [bacterium]
MLRAGEASAFYRLAQSVLRVSFSLLQGLQVQGLENVPRQGGFILVCNHLSWLDPPVLGCSLRHRQLHFMAKKELFERPYLGPLIRALGAFPVERGQADRKSLRLALELLGRGRIVCLFPEGTRGDGGPMGPWHVGLAMLAHHAQVPILPAAVSGTRTLLEDRKLPQPRRPIRVAFGPAIRTDLTEGHSRARLQEIQERSLAGVQALLRGFSDR